MDQSKRRHRTGQKAEASLHPFRGCERKLALLEHVFERMDGQFLMALEDHQIVAVSLVVSEEEVLAVDRINVLPVFKRQLDCRERRMRMKLIAESMLLKEVKYLGYTWVIYHLLRLLA
jgi:hypothetical protein